MKRILHGFVFFGLVYISLAGITEEQMRQTAATIRNICQPRWKLTDDVIDKMREGVFDTDKATKMKKSKVNYDAAMKQFDLLLPDDMKEPYTAALTRCKDVTNGEKNSCEAAYKLLMCFKTDNPKFTFV